LSGILVSCALVAAVASAVAVRAESEAQKEAQTGTFALLGGTQESIAKGWATHGAGTSATLKVKQFKMNGTTPIEHYTLNGPNTIFMFVIRDDFGTFNQLETYSNVTTGTFSASFTKLGNRSYYLYADTIPLGMNRQVFRFKSPADSPGAAPAFSTTPTTTAAAGPYVVTLERDTFPPNSKEILYLQVTRGGKPAQDLAPMVNGSGTAFMIDTNTLQYVHLHPVLRGSKINTEQTYTLGQEMQRQASNSQVGPNQQMDVPPLPAGVYKLWFEFSGGVSMDRFAAGPFTIVVR
jgi:hypothetical protein